MKNWEGANLELYKVEVFQNQSMYYVFRVVIITARDLDHLLSFSLPESANAIDVGLFRISYDLSKNLTARIQLPTKKKTDHPSVKVSFMHTKLFKIQNNLGRS